MSEQRHADLGITPVEPEDGETLIRRGQVMRRARILTIVVLIILVAGGARTVLMRMANSRTLEANVAEQAKLYVRVANPKALDAGPTLSLPGSLQGFVQAPIGACERLPAPLVQGHRQQGAKG